ncbi:polyketide synthase [Heterostelium album PN500]|uniref:Polyketide synthase n=1 Tax=Heterostelium pallidum (strain ATCC 26659 / Pp 5 / PN500) TaxID=670386 RepID=D3B1J7_HETP5|nr:polyketide synthase [Heterostelium album PN500]EFA85171.1 polyketide synthase [Heterostelium album PN500]|eukprot:XP_020437280.1 polyketide synthase [Heterostelium album PN500]
MIPINSNSHNVSDNDVAIIGIGLRLPGNSSTPENFWNNLVSSFDGIVKVPTERWSESFSQHNLITNVNAGLLELDEWKKFDPLFFGMAPKDAAAIDPQERMMLTLTYEALEDAQIPSQSLRGSNTGVFVGVSNIGYTHFQTPSSPLDPAPYVLTDYFTHSIIANRVSYCFDFRGPSMCIDTACSSSLFSTDLAIQHIQNGQCDIALGCGVNALFDAESSMGYSRLGVLTDHCRSFDADGKGFVRSEGCGVVVMKRLSLAERDGNRIYAIVKGRNTNGDGRCNKDTMSSPSSETQSVNIKQALQRSNIKPSDIYYVEAHATGTIVGDPIEVKALADVFTDNHTPENPLKIGSIKSNIGHLESAAGIASFIKVSLMLKNRKLVPNIKLTKLNPKIPFKESNIQVVTEVEDLPNDRLVLMSVNSFGIGGTNCHIILQEYRNNSFDNQLQRKIENVTKPFLIPISGNCTTSNNKYVEAIKESQNRVSLREFALYQSLTKSHHSVRKVIVAKDWEEFDSQALAFNGVLPNKDSVGKKLIYVFCGQGPQWNQMGMQLYESEPVYRSTVDKLDSLLSEYTGYSIIAKLNDLASESNDIHRPIIAQPSLFLFQVGLVELYRSWGMQPSIVLGHSMYNKFSFGDITSAYISGNISLSEAIKIVHFRALYQNETIGSGKMLVVGLSSTIYQAKYQEKYPTLEIACYNAAESIVITGSELDLTALSKELKSSDIFNTFLRTPCSFHSSHQKTIKKKIFSSLSNMKSQKSTIPWYSTVTGELKSDEMDANYLYQNLRQPVYFKKTIDTLFTELNTKLEEYVFLEIAPHPTLSGLILQTIPHAKVLSPLQRNKDELLLFRSSIASLHCLGVNIEFSTQFTYHDIMDQQWRDNTSILPRYQWDSELYWRESPYSKYKRTNGPSTSLLGHQSLFNGQLVYHADIDIKRKPYQYLKDHRVKDKPLFPGAGYIDAIIDAFKSHEKDIIINHLEFLNPFFLNESEFSQKLQTNIDKLSNNDYKLQFYNKNKECENTDDDWFKTAQSRVSLASSVEPVVVDIESFKNLCDLTTYTQEEFYKKTLRVGLKYGPAFQHVKSIAIGERTTFATLSTLSSSNAPSHILNATLLDNCAHGLFGILEDRRQFIFKSIEDLRVNFNVLKELESNPPEQLFLLSKVLNFNNYDCVGNCQLVLPNGQVILEMGKFTAGTNERMKMKKIKFPVNELYELRYQSKDSVLPQPNEIVTASLIPESMECQKILGYACDSVKFLCYQFVNDVPGFDIKEILEQPIEDSFVKLNLAMSDSNFKLFTRVVEIFREYREFLEQNELNDQSEYRKYDTNIKSNMEACIKFVTETLIGNVAYGEQLFRDGVVHGIYNSAFMMYYFKQTSHIASSAISSLVEANKQSKKPEKRVIKILEIGGGTGTLTNILIPQLDAILEGQEEIEVVYTFTDVSPYFIAPMKEKLTNGIKLKSNLKIKFKILDLEKDFIEQGLLEGSYDMVLMSLVIHVAAEIVPTVHNIHKIISPNGWLLFIEPNHKNPFVDITFGGFSQIWNYKDDIRDHYSLKPQEWVDLLSENIGFYNTKSYGPNDELGNQLSPDLGHLYIILSQRTPIEKHEVGEIERMTLIVNENQSIPIEIFEKYSGNPISIVNTNEIESSSEILRESDQILFLTTVEQQTVENYQQTTFQLTQLLQLFTYQDEQPIVAAVTRGCETSNYLSNSIAGVLRTAFIDHKELKVVHIDIDTPLDDNNIKTILQISRNESSLGDYYYQIVENVPRVSRATNIKKELLSTSVVYENQYENTQCSLNLKLEYKLANKVVLLPNQIEVQVKAVGLNFKDYLFHLQMLPQALMSSGDIYHPPFGLECSGIITRIGSGVTKFKVGDEVVAGGCARAIGSHTTFKEIEAVLKPENISFNDAASLSVVYGTVYYCFFNVCHFDPENETVLIHSATGGVGIAALNILRWLKCKKVYATAGSKDKIEYLKSKYSDILIDVFDSHTTDFAKLIKEQCDGVDVLINTLSVDFMPANFKVMAPWGRIADLSLTHVYNNDPLDFGNFKNDITYTPVDYQYLTTHRPTVVNRITTKIVKEVSEGNLELPPTRVYEVKETKEAIKSMRDRTHIGKIIVDCSTIDEEIVKPLVESKQRSQLPKSDYKLDINNTVLVTGQNGIALEMVPWLAKHTNATDIIVVSKSTLNNRLQKIIKSTGPTKIHFYQADVSNKEQLQTQIASFKDKYPPIESIFHLAVILEALSINELTLENIKKVHDPKVIGAFNLHEISLALELPIRQFVVFSSLSGMSGAASQPAYNSANLVLDGLCQYRTNELGLLSKSIRWGPLLGEGQVADAVGIKEYFLHRGVESLPLSKFFGGLEAILSQSIHCNPIVSNITTPAIYDFHPHIRHCIDHLVVGETGKKKSLESTEDVYEMITNSFSTLLSIPKAKLNGDTKLKDFGVDSLMTVQVKLFLDNNFEKDLFRITEIPSLTINTVISKIKNQKTTVNTSKSS